MHGIIALAAFVPVFLAHASLHWALVLLNLAAFGLFGWDKAQARLQASRIPEAVLLGLCVVAAPGAALGRALFRHKTLHGAFTLALLAGIALQWALCR